MRVSVHVLLAAACAPPAEQQEMPAPSPTVDTTESPPPPPPPPPEEEDETTVPKPPVSTSPVVVGTALRLAATFDGATAASAGDVNGDGFDDILIGSPDDGGSGAAYLYLGSASGVETSPAWEGHAEPWSYDSGYGASVASAGDVNGDGYGDVIVGARDHDGVTAEGYPLGAAYVYLGSSEGLSAEASWSDTGRTVWDLGFGAEVGSAGDVNGDGFGDVIVGDGEAGFVYLGGADGLAAERASQVGGIFFYSGQIAAAGDVHADGYDDVLIGWGPAALYAGEADGLSSTASWVVPAAGPVSDFVAMASGDVDLDGYSDVLVGHEHLTNGELREGGLRLYLGSSAGPPDEPWWAIESDQVDNYLGWSVALSDVDGDGYLDVLASATTPRRTSLYLGSADGPETTPVWTASAASAEPDTYFGRVTAAGDVNGDGRGDILIAEPGFDWAGLAWGRVLVFEGCDLADSDGDGLGDACDPS